MSCAAIPDIIGQTVGSALGGAVNGALVRTNTPPQAQGAAVAIPNGAAKATRAGEAQIDVQTAALYGDASATVEAQAKQAAKELSKEALKLGPSDLSGLGLAQSGQSARG